MPDIHHELLIGAPVEIIYNAITIEEELSAWWTPDTKAEPETGSIAHFPFGPAYFKEMKITELQPNEQVKWLCIKGAEEWIGTMLSFKLEPADLNAHPEIQGQLEQQGNNEDPTLLIFHHNNWKEYTSMYAECNYTWGQFLRSLKLFCETGKGRPWPHQHSIHLP